jgi:hypothetical protein
LFWVHNYASSTGKARNGNPHLIVLARAATRSATYAYDFADQMAM